MAICLPLVSSSLMRWMLAKRTVVSGERDEGNKVKPRVLKRLFVLYQHTVNLSSGESVMTH